ncbi:acetyl-CoA hydrolase/transferase family protein [Pseudonocardia sp. KRD291]|uniref:acetyl-CoA hydrolase/transferase family protein n=1 Tax=Pseudonocardia sp. KRD291 TaxID=2792007 RepID=UPI001C4A14F2|nr:acetyl-CoA hydrolase/transferase C-terminal domain-containing protein [Pseudonocardia sp. KRD291]MBW0105230.1 acetyl-CoA hydrolase/transferase family protein [Pseudonocardia sp. KRD291]
MIDLAPHVPAGSGLWWGQAAAESGPLVDALLDQVTEIGPCRAFCGLTWNRRVTRELPEALSLTSYGALGDLRALSVEGRLDVVPVHYSGLPRLFAEGLLPRDVGLLQVSPPGPDGLCTVGIGADYTADALLHTRTLIAEINHRMPATRGTPGIPVERFAATIETDRPLVPAPEREPDAVDQAIAGHVCELVADGDTVQIGVGPLPTAILDGLTGHRDLGFHAGMATDAVLRLVETGALTGSRKEIDTGIVVTGTVIGSTALYQGLDRMPVEFRPAGYTHSPRVLSQLRTLVSINSAVEVDLTGQVGAEVRRGRYIGGIGGQADFSGAAARTGSRSVIALRSRSGDESTIVAALRGGVVTTARADVDVVVTEYGAAHLRGATPGQAAQRLIAIAAPESRDELTRSLAP